MVVYLVMMYIASLALGYVLAFTEATLAIGRFLSDAGTQTGYQNAITPPLFSKFAIAVYVISLTGIIYGWWKFSWLFGLGITVGFLFALVVNKIILLPKSDSEHFRKIIVHSMINRHADLLKSGDTLRASIMAELLDKLGYPVNEFIEHLQKNDT
jgi:hypothetical protein